jgi:hypothetical protein
VGSRQAARSANPSRRSRTCHGLAIHDDTIAVATSNAVIVLDAHATRA